MTFAASRDDWDAHWRDFDAVTKDNPAEHMRFQLLLRHLQLRTGAVRVLDVGSGQGELLGILTRAHPGVDAAGLELSRSGVEIAAGRLPGVRFEQRDLLAEGDPPDDLRGWATHATCSEVLEHVDDPVTLLRNASAYMAAGCRLVVTVPGGPMSAFDRHIGHRGHFTPGRLRSVLEAADFSVDRCGGTGFPFFNLYRLVVVARGRRLISDVASADGAPVSGVARLVMRAFGLLFRLNPPAWRLGWQVVAVAHLKRTATSR